MYQEFYNLIVTHVFDGAVLNSFQELVVTEISTIASLAMVALPLWFFMRIVFR